MSVFFVVAQLLYAGCCPALVKDFGDYGEYRAAYAGPEHLTATLIKMVSSASRGEILRCADEYFSIPGQQRESQPETEYPLEALRDLLVRNFRDLMYCGCLRGSPAYGMEDLRVVDEERLSNELERALRMSGRLHRTTFWLSAACFATGVSLFLWVARETVVNGVPLILNT